MCACLRGIVFGNRVLLSFHHRGNTLACLNARMPYYFCKLGVRLGASETIASELEGKDSRCPLVGGWNLIFITLVAD